MTTYTFTPAQITACDLVEEMNELLAAGETVSTYRVTLYRDDTTPHAETADALYVPSVGRLGIAWGAEADWADVKDLDAGIEMWATDSEAWEANR